MFDFLKFLYDSPGRAMKAILSGVLCAVVVVCFVNGAADFLHRFNLRFLCN